MPTYKPPLVIIAPKGEEYSSLTEEYFELYNNPDLGDIIELTLEEYAAWVITADSLEAKFESPTDTAVLTLRRYKLDESQNPTDEIQDFPGIAPGSFDAIKTAIGGLFSYKSIPITSIFRATQEERNSGGVNLLLADEASFIRPFYHKDKFYLWWSFYRSQDQGVQVTTTPTLLTVEFPPPPYSDIPPTIVTYKLNV